MWACASHEDDEDDEDDEEDGATSEVRTMEDGVWSLHARGGSVRTGDEAWARWREFAVVRVGVAAQVVGVAAEGEIFDQSASRGELRLVLGDE